MPADAGRRSTLNGRIYALCLPATLTAPLTALPGLKRIGFGYPTAMPGPSRYGSTELARLQLSAYLSLRPLPCLNRSTGCAAIVRWLGFMTRPEAEA